MSGELGGGTSVPATPEEKDHRGSLVLLSFVSFGKISVENEFASADYFVGQVLGPLDGLGDFGSVN